MLWQIVEELEDRLGDRMEDILSDVKSSLTSSPVQITSNEIHPDNFSFHGPENHTVHADTDEEVYIQEEIVFDDMGEGAGVEGDLDMDDDWWESKCKREQFLNAPSLRQISRGLIG